MCLQRPPPVARAGRRGRAGGGGGGPRRSCCRRAHRHARTHTLMHASATHPPTHPPLQGWRGGQTPPQAPPPAAAHAPSPRAGAQAAAPHALGLRGGGGRGGGRGVRRCARGGEGACHSSKYPHTHARTRKHPRGTCAPPPPRPLPTHPPTRDAAGDGLADPPRRIGGELEALAGVKLVHAALQAHHPLRNQVLPGMGGWVGGVAWGERGEHECGAASPPARPPIALQTHALRPCTHTCPHTRAPAAPALGPRTFWRWRSPAACCS